MEIGEIFYTVYDWLESLISRYGVLGIAAAMFAESAGVPFASTIVLLTAGTLILRGNLPFWSVLLASTAGITAGSIFSYSLGALCRAALGRPFNGNNYCHTSRINFLPASPRKGLLSLWKRYGDFSIFMAQLWGVSRTFISYPAGAMHMHFGLFLAYTFLGGALFSMGAIALSITLAGTVNLTYKLLQRLLGFPPWLAAVIFPVLLLLYLAARRGYFNALAVKFTGLFRKSRLSGWFIKGPK